MVTNERTHFMLNLIIKLCKYRILMFRILFLWIPMGGIILVKSIQMWMQPLIVISEEVQANLKVKILITKTQRCYKMVSYWKVKDFLRKIFMCPNILWEMLHSSILSIQIIKVISTTWYIWRSMRFSHLNYWSQKRLMMPNN